MFCLITLSKISQMEQNTLSELDTVPRNSEYRSVPPEKTTRILAAFREFLMKKVYIDIAVFHVDTFFFSSTAPITYFCTEQNNTGSFTLLFYHLLFVKLLRCCVSC